MWAVERAFWAVMHPDTAIAPAATAALASWGSSGKPVVARIDDDRKMA